MTTHLSLTSSLSPLSTAARSFSARLSPLAVRGVVLEESMVDNVGRRGGDGAEDEGSALGSVFDSILGFWSDG